MSKSPEFMQVNPMENEAGLYCKISIAGNEDLEEILKLQKLVYHENAVRYNDYTIAPLTRTMEDLKGGRANSSIILKAVEDGKIVGSVRAFKKDGSCRIGKADGTSGLSKQGLGKKLMRAIEKCFSVLRYELFYRAFG